MKAAGAGDPKQLEGFVIKQLLKTSGVFKGTDAAGSALTSDLFADTLADAIAGAGGFGVSSLLTPPAPEPHAHLEGQTSGFGERRDPFTGQRTQHGGVDLAAPEGTPIPAAKDGVVIAAGPRGGYGNAIELQHADGTTTLYGHASQVNVTPGMSVKTGDAIGLVGQTGRSTGPHLHLELRREGHRLDPGQALKSYRLRAEENGGGSP